MDKFISNHDFLGVSILQIGAEYYYVLTNNKFLLAKSG